MMTRQLAETMVDFTSGRRTEMPVTNDDLIGHEAEIAGGPVPLYLRLLPRWLRVRIETRRTEAAMIALWRDNPHLLEDMGVVMTRARDLPDHLIPAPARLLDAVAASAPQVIVAAELAYPPEAPLQAPQPGESAAGRAPAGAQWQMAK